MDHEVKAFKGEGVDRGRAPLAEARPRVVERARTCRQSQAREIEGHAAELVRGQHAEQLAIQERRRGDAVQAEHRLPVARLPDEAPYAGRAEFPTRGPMGRDHRTVSARRSGLRWTGSGHEAWSTGCRPGAPSCRRRRQGGRRPRGSPVRQRTSRPSQLTRASRRSPGSGPSRSSKARRALETDQQVRRRHGVRGAAAHDREAMPPGVGEDPLPPFRAEVAWPDDDRRACGCCPPLAERRRGWLRPMTTGVVTP
jgi:hypothetical protein